MRATGRPGRTQYEPLKDREVGFRDIPIPLRFLRVHLMCSKTASSRPRPVWGRGARASAAATAIVPRSRKSVGNNVVDARC